MVLTSVAVYRLPDPIKQLNITACFICDAPLTKDNLTLEHLVPQWIIRAFLLQDSTISVGPSFRVRYMDFLVPCCRECNVSLLSPVEAKLARLFKRQDASVPNEIPIRLLAIWCCKILTGLYVYERLFTPNDGFGVERNWELQENWNGLRKDYLRMLRGRFSVTDDESIGFPFSVFTFRTKVPDDVSRRFDLQFCSDLQSVYLRIAQWTVLTRLDAGFLARYGERFLRQFAPYELAPKQVEEIAAHFFTMAGRQRRSVTHFRFTSQDRQSLVYDPLPISDPFIQPENDNDLLAWMSILCRIPAEEVQLSEASRLTFLLDQNDNLLDISADA